MQTNVIYCGDCQKVLVNHIPDESVELVYLDPPFFSNRHFELLFNDGFELRSFEDRWKGGIENYIAWMEGKLRECHRILKKTGSIYIHCDWHANAHLRILMDKIFGESNFQNEIIWHYNTGGASKKHFSKKHDNIYLYTKSGHFTFNAKAISEPYRETKTNHFNLKEKDTGRMYRIRTVNGKDYKYYLDEGRIPHDVWAIDSIDAVSKERMGYPTQKPEALLERIIKASSNPNDIVLDPFAGCATTIAVAHQSKRRWIGIDVSPTACRLMVSRMRKLGVAINESDIIGMPKTLDEIKAMTWIEFQNWVCQKLMARISPKLRGEMGVDGTTFDGSPVQVKQSEGVGRNVVDNFVAATLRVKKKHGIIVALSFGRGAYEEVARLKNEDGIEIELKTVEELLKET